MTNTAPDSQTQLDTRGCYSLFRFGGLIRFVSDLETKKNQEGVCSSISFFEAPKMFEEEWEETTNSEKNLPWL